MTLQLIQANLPPIVAGAAVLILLALMLSARRRSIRARREREAVQAQIEELRQENRAAADNAARLGRQVKKLEEQLAQIGTRMESAKTQEQMTESNHAYAQAIRQVRRGADAERLMNDFGLTRGEAELLTRLHGQRKTDALAAVCILAEKIKEA